MPCVKQFVIPENLTLWLFKSPLHYFVDNVNIKKVILLLLQKKEHNKSSFQDERNQSREFEPISGSLY